MKLISFASFFISLLTVLTSSAQQEGKISGIIRDQTQTIPSATVLLYAAKDSSLVSTIMTDNEGKYTFNASSNKYYIVATSIGYSKVSSQAFDFKAGSTYNSPALTLSETSKQLNEVSVTATKPILERRADKLIFNIEATPSAAGLTGLEALKKAPGVTIDQNDNISLSGKSNVLVTIDGKQSYLSGADIINLLKSMQSSQIESIEIINNPGARYDANATGGIINIRTKKSQTEGFNGSLNLGAGFNKYINTNNSIDINFRKKNFNIFGSYGYYSNKQEQHTIIERKTASPADAVYFSQRNKDTSVYQSNNFKVGTDIFLSKNHTLGFLFKGNTSKYNSTGFSNVNIGNSFTSVDSILRSTTTNNNPRQTYSYNINYKGILDTAGQELSIDADYSKYTSDDNATNSNLFYYPNGSFYKNGEIYRSFAPSNIDIKAIKVDYTLAFKKSYKFDAGAKFSDVQSYNNYIYENRKNTDWIFDQSKSNQFNYKERVNAAYTTIAATYGKTSIVAGLRIENTHSTGNSITQNQVTTRKYTDLFPSLSIAQNFNADNTLNFSYSRKINRPNYRNLNPFVFYLDQYTYNQGNPNLKPEYANNLEVAYLFKKKYSVALNYTRISDVISQVLLQDESKKSMYQTVLNLASQQVTSLTLNFPVKINNWWSMNNNILGYYKKIEQPGLNGSYLNSKVFSTSLYAQNDFSISKQVTADAGVYYSTPQIEGALKIQSFFTTDAGLRYNFPDKSGNLKLGISDVFHSQRPKVSSTLPGNDYKLEQYGNTTNIRLTFTYRFGKMTVKSARNRNTGLDDEQKRLNK